MQATRHVQRPLLVLSSEACDGHVVVGDGNVIAADGNVIAADGNVTVADGNVVIDGCTRRSSKIWSSKSCRLIAWALARCRKILTFSIKVGTKAGNDVTDGSI